VSTSEAYFGYGLAPLAYRPTTTKSATVRGFLAKPHNIERWRATIPEPKALTSSETANSYDCIKSRRRWLSNKTNRLFWRAISLLSLTIACREM
jgi:hypothetical protein